MLQLSWLGLIVINSLENLTSSDFYVSDFSFVLLKQVSYRRDLKI